MPLFDYGGLLSPEDKRKQMLDMLLPLGLGLMSAGQPTTDPAQRQKAMLQAFQLAAQQQAQQRDRMLKEKLFGLQYDKALREQKAEERQLAARQQLGGLLGRGGGLMTQGGGEAAGLGVAAVPGGLGNAGQAVPRPGPSLGETLPVALEAYPSAAGGLLQDMFKPEKSLERLAAEAQARATGTAAGTPPKAPTTRTVRRDDQTVTQEWTPTGGWQDVAAGPAFQPREPTALNFLLPDRRTALSYDGGRTYLDPRTGASLPMPAGSVRLGLESGAAESRAARQSYEASQSLQGEAQTGEPGRRDLSQAARQGGTGPWSNLAASVDAVAGGIGLDKITGKEGFFQDTTDNRNALTRLIQMTKEAFIVSDRGSEWEQKMVARMYPNPETFWANPATEARKLLGLKQDLVELKTFNLQTLASGTLDPPTASKFVRANLEIDRALALMGGSGTGSAPSQADEDLMLRKKYLGR